MNGRDAVVIAAVGVGLYLFFKREVSDAAAAVGNAINPASDENLAYRGVNAVGGALSGDEHWTLGGWLYDILHPSADNIAAAEVSRTGGYEPRKLQVRREAVIYDYLISRG